MLTLKKLAEKQLDIYNTTFVSINFTEYKTGKPIASCRGAYAFGWSKQNDMKVATNRAIEQVQILFKKK